MLTQKIKTILTVSAKDPSAAKKVQEPNITNQIKRCFTLVGLLILISLISSSIHADEIKISCERFDVLLHSSGGLAKVVPQANRGQEKKSDRPGESIFTLELQKTVYGMTDGARRKIPLDVLSKNENILTASSKAEPDARVTFKLADKKDYITFNLLKAESPKGEHATILDVNLWPLIRNGLERIPLAGDVTSHRASMFFRELHKPPFNPGKKGFALWCPEAPELDDEILYKIWVNEGIPHPKIEGEWTIERAKKWNADYIKLFEDYSEMYIAGESVDELKQLVDEAAKNKISCVYMHIPHWSGRYWPDDRPVYDMNRKLFPRGQADFRKLVDYAKSKGVRFGLRMLSNPINLKNPQYNSAKRANEFSHYWRGNLVEDIGPESKELIIKSDETMPTSYTASQRGWFDKVYIGNELLRFEGYKENEDGTITLKVKKRDRGYANTKAAAHKAGTPVRILMGVNEQLTIGETGSKAWHEVIDTYADFNNRMELITAEFDGTMIFGNRIGLKSNFLGAIYGKLDHHVIAAGTPRWGYFEKRFSTVKKAFGLDRSINPLPWVMTLRMGLHQDHWPAPNPYGYTYGIVPHAVKGTLKCHLFSQDGLHTMDLKTMKNYGFVADCLSTVKLWRKHGRTLPESVKQRVWSGFKGGRHPTQEEHFRFEENGKGLDVVPFQPMRRPVIDRGWGYIQEHGPVYTYQYIRPNSKGLVNTNNPYHAQVPEFIIRVMKDFNRDMLSGYVKQGEKSKGSEWMEKILQEKDLSDADGQVFNNVKTEKSGKVNYNIMIPRDAVAMGENNGKKKRKDSFSPGKMQLEAKKSGIQVTYANTTNKEIKFDKIGKGKSDLVSYHCGTSIKNAKGLGIVITGDGSGALYLVRIRGGSNRDFIIPIDFKGKRYIEIPDPQVSWSDARWPVTNEWKRWNGHTVKSIITGFGKVPPSTKASVLVEDIRLLPEKDSSLVSPVIHCGSGTITVKGTIPSDTYMWYKGVNKLELFDLNWNKLSELPVVEKNARVPSGPSTITVTNNNKDGDPWLECQFLVKDKPVHHIKEK